MKGEKEMTLKECYDAIGGNYDDVVSRFHSEKIVKKFVLKFLNDSSYELLCTSMKDENYEEAFRAAHTIKGICQNLSITRLYEISGQLCEALRNGFTPEAPTLVERTKEEYQQTLAAIKEYQRQNEVV